MNVWKRLLGARRRRRPAPSVALEPGSLRDSLVALIVQLSGQEIDCALVGAVALAAHGVVRGTRDLDFLVAAEQEPAVHDLMGRLGFETLDRGESVSSYLLERLRVDFLLARRDYGLSMLARAEPVPITSALDVRVVLLEDLLGLKLQALVSNPARGKDRADIEALLRAHASTIRMDIVHMYATAIGAERELEDIMAAIGRGPR